MNDQETGLPAGTDLPRWVRIGRRFEAPPDRIFRAWTDPDELQRWLPERVEGSLAVGTRSVLAWPQERVWWEVVEARSAQSLVVKRPWSADDRIVTTARVGIEPAGYGSRVELEDGPFLLEEPGGLDAWARALGWWGEVMLLLRAHLDFSVDLRPRS